MSRPARLRCCKCWRKGVPPLWLLVCGAVVVQIGFGVYPVVVKKFAQNSNANPVIFSFYRDLCCIPVLFICAFVAERKLMVPSPSALLTFVTLGLLGMFGNQLLFILGVYLAGPDIASAFQPIIPVWTAVLGLFVCVEKPISPVYLHMWTKAIGIILAAGGAIEITLIGSLVVDSNSNNSTDLSSSTASRTSKDYILGCLCLFGNTLCMAFYVLFQKKFVFNRQNFKWKNYPVAVTAWSYFFGAVFMGLASLYVIPFKNAGEYKLPMQSAIALVFAIFVTSALCYLLITWTTMYLSAIVVTIFWPVQVLVTVVLSHFFVGENLQPWQYAGAVMLLIGLFLVLFSNYMDERNASNRRVVRLDCCKRSESKSRGSSRCSTHSSSDVDETKPLISSSNGYKVCKVNEESQSSSGSFDGHTPPITPEHSSVHN